MAQNNNDMIKRTQLEKLKKFQEPLEHLHSEDNAVILAKIQEKLGVSLDSQQANEIKRLEDRIQSAIGSEKITQYNVHTIVDLLQTISSDIQQAQSLLLTLTANERYLQDESQKRAVLYQLNRIYSRARQLKLLVEQIKSAIENNKIPEREIQTIMAALYNTAYFKNKKNIPISISDWLANIFLPKIAEIGQQCGVEKEKTDRELPEATQPTETLPRWLQEITALALGNHLRNKYQRTSAYLNTDRFNDKVAHFIQTKLTPNKTRIAQLKLIEDTLKLLNKSEYNADQKIKIARGLMLFVKYQIEHQDNKFKSRLGVMLDEYINSTDNSGEKIRKFEAKECMEAFRDFSKTRLKTRNKIQGAIEKAVNDNSNWKHITTTYYQLKQKNDADPNKPALVFTYPKLGTQEKKNKKISEVRIQIMKIKTSIDQYPNQLSQFEAMYQETMQADLIALSNKKITTSLSTVPSKLNYARSTYEAMCESRIKNVSAEKLVKEIQELTDPSEKDNSIQGNIAYLDRLIKHSDTPPKEDEQKQIYIYLRLVEQQLETLVYLAEIAELKLDPSVNRIRHVSHRQATVLTNAVEAISRDIERFKDIREKAHQKLGIRERPIVKYN